MIAEAVPKSAERVINFVERLTTHTKGTWGSKKFLLADFQKNDIIIPTFGPTDNNGVRKVRTCYVEIPKKNGKSELAAALGLFGLLADINPETGKPEEGAEVYIAAAARKQAEIIFNVCVQMVRNSGYLSSRLRIYETTKTIIIKDRPNCFLRAISADSGTADGVNPSMIIFDELHRQKGRDLYDVLKKGTATRLQPLTILLTTAGIESESPLCWDLHVYAEQIIKGIFKDEAFHAVIYSLHEDEDWKLEKNWTKVNPASIGPLAFKRLDAIREDFKEAKRLPSQENGFRRYHLNQWVSQEERWIPLSEWDKPGMKEAFNVWELEGRPAFAALDISARRDITALVVLVPVGSMIFVVPYFWLPEHEIREKSERDRVPYERWRDQGLLELIPGKTVNQKFVRERINSIAKLYSIQEIAVDPWNAVQLSQDLTDDGLTVVEFRQGVKSYTGPSKQFERYVLQDNTIRHGGHPILRWMVDCVTVRRTVYDEIAPVKPDRLKSTKRIDGVVALIMALDRIERHREEMDDFEDFVNSPVIVG